MSGTKRKAADAPSGKGKKAKDTSPTAMDIDFGKRLDHRAVAVSEVMKNAARTNAQMTQFKRLRARAVREQTKAHAGKAKSNANKVEDGIKALQILEGAIRQEEKRVPKAVHTAFKTVYDKLMAFLLELKMTSKEASNLDEKVRNTLEEMELLMSAVRRSLTCMATSAPIFNSMDPALGVMVAPVGTGFKQSERGQRRRQDDANQKTQLGVD